MRKIAFKIRDVALLYLKWGWPTLLAASACHLWLGESNAPWRDWLNDAAFAWILCAPVAPLSLLFNREIRERSMGSLCGLREGDERERSISGEAARGTLLLALSLEVVLLAMTLVSVRLSWDPNVPKGEKHGMLSVGMTFSSSRHLDPFGVPKEKPGDVTLGAAPETPKSEIEMAGGFLLAPSTFPVLAVLILIQLAAFRAFAARRYEGAE